MTFREVPIGAAFDVRNGATPASGEPGYWGGDIPWVGPADLGGLSSRFIERGERSITQEGYESCGTQMVPAGSIILSIRAPIGHMAIASRPMCFNQGCRGLVPRAMVRSDFAYWALCASRQRLEAAGQGTTFLELARDKLRAERIPLPDQETQKSVANFLDHETARIDYLVEKKGNLIGLLMEKRIALITTLVSGRQSCVEDQCQTTLRLFSHIPDDWAVERLRYSIRGIDQGWSPEAENRVVSDGEWGVLKVGCVNHGIFRAVEHKALPSDTQPRPEYKVNDGDLLMSRGNTLELVGSAAIVQNAPPKLMLSDLLYRLNVFPARVDTQFLAFAMSSRPLRYQIEVLASGASDTMPKISQAKIRRLQWLRPPLEVQKRIVGELKRRLGSMDEAVAAIERSVERLGELRSALIEKAVTGRLDIACWRHRGEIDRRLDKIEEDMTAGRAAGQVEASA